MPPVANSFSNKATHTQSAHHDWMGFFYYYFIIILIGFTVGNIDLDLKSSKVEQIHITFLSNR